MSFTQLTGNIRAGLTPDTAVDVSEDVTRWLVTETMETVGRRKSFALVSTRQAKSGVNGSLGIDFDTDPTDATTLRALARTAMHDDATDDAGREPGELWVAGTEFPGAVGAGNPMTYGWALVADLDIFGGTPGEVRSQSKTWPLRDIQTVTTDPAPEGS